MSRLAQFTEILGEPGTGKTTLLVKILDSLIKKGDRAIVIDPDGNEPAWFDYELIGHDETDKIIQSTGIIVLEYEHGITFPLLTDLMSKGKLKNLHLVMDDPSVYTESHPEDELKHILRRKRQFGVDIWSTAHGFTEIPPLFFTFITQYALKKTADDPERKKRNIPHYEMHMEKKAIADKAGLNDPYFTLFYDSYGNLIKPS